MCVYVCVCVSVFVCVPPTCPCIQRLQAMYITVLPLLFTAATPPTHPEGIEQTGTNTAAGTYVCARVCLCVRVHECMCGGVLVSNCVFVHVNDLCLIASTCKYIRTSLLFIQRGDHTHQAQEPIMREFCPSGSSCYNCAHDLSLSLNIVRINATRSHRAE